MKIARFLSNKYVISGKLCQAEVRFGYDGRPLGNHMSSADP